MAKFDPKKRVQDREEGDRRKVRSRLTDRERRFCQMIVQGVSKAEAHAKSGHTLTKKPCQATVKASAILRRPVVIEYLAALRLKVEEKAVLSAAELVRQQVDLANLNLADLFNPDGSVKEPSEWGVLGLLVRKFERDPETGRIIKVETWDKDKNWDRLNKVYGLYENDNKKIIEIRQGSPALKMSDIKQLPTEELRRLAESNDPRRVEPEVLDGEFEGESEKQV